MNCSDIPNSLECIQAAQYASDISLATSLLMNFVLFLIFLILFLFFKKRVKAVYEPLSNELKYDNLSIQSPNCGIFGWLKSSWQVTDMEIETKRGPHSVMYLNILKYLFFIIIA